MELELGVSFSLSGTTACFSELTTVSNGCCYLNLIVQFIFNPEFGSS
jgi:hypothetical protein